MMKDDKLIELLGMYATRAGPWLNRLEDDQYDLHVSQYVTMNDRKKQVGHAAWMAAEAIRFIEEASALDAPPLEWPAGELDERMGMRRRAARSKREKAHRWLGFIQGVLWMAGAFTLNELKEHSRRCSDEPDKPEMQMKIEVRGVEIDEEPE
jgi:hypothetical protein